MDAYPLFLLTNLSGPSRGDVNDSAGLDSDIGYVDFASTASTITASWYETMS